MPTLKISYDDLTPFADLGTSVEVLPSGFSLTRDGGHIAIKTKNDGYDVTSADGKNHHYLTGGALLGSSHFADLLKIARNQAVILEKQRVLGIPVPITSTMSEIHGSIPDLVRDRTPWDSLDVWLNQLQQSQSLNGTDLVLINGPAGVGKTTIVREAALKRAESFDGSAPLIVQIASRGRVLQNIADLIAFTLQEMRSNLTIGQLMSLMRHGLITLAIDGFDELSDPNGFETAWSGLNNLIKGVRGSATFLLAGRETFISTDTMLRQLSSFDSRKDRLALLSLSDPDPDAARDWLLKQNGWDRTLLEREFVEPIFEQGSYALRPFFLTVIAREPEALKSNTPPASDLLNYLVDVMTRREADKFVDALDPPNGSEATHLYEAYVGRFLEEVARDLAENQSESISDDALDLLARVAADDLLPDDQIAAVVQRARTIVFLANDLRAGHVRFAHEQLLQHFLAREALRSVGYGETPRYVRRNLFGREALEIFGHVARERPAEAERFVSAIRTTIAKPSRDRTNINLAVLGVAAACGAALEDANLEIRDVGLNELHFPFAAPNGISLRDTAISILYASSTDIRNVVFENGVHISTLEIDQRTRLPAQIPLPQLLVRPKGTTSDPREIRVALRGGDTSQELGEPAWADDIAELLGRIERYRPFWLGTLIDDTDPQGRRIISHPDWPVMYAAMKELDLVTVKSRQASGTSPEFIHFRQDVLSNKKNDLHRAILEINK